MTPHFSDAELACKCGCGMLPQLDAVEKLELLRFNCGFGLPVSSGARCPKHNAAESSTGDDGPHTTGRAFDIPLSRERALILVREALALGYTGIGIKQKGESRFVHIDDLPNTPSSPRPTIWSY